MKYLSFNKPEETGNGWGLKEFRNGFYYETSYFNTKKDAMNYIDEMLKLQNLTRYEMFKHGLFILLSPECFTLCYMDEPKNLKVLKSFKTRAAAINEALKSNYYIVEE